MYLALENRSLILAKYVTKLILNRLDYLTSLANRSSKQDDDLRELTTLKKSHLKESEVKFASLKYDMTVLASKI